MKRSSMIRLTSPRLGWLPMGRPMSVLMSVLMASITALTPLGALAGDLRLRLELAWGTDGVAPEGKNLKELDAKGREKLRHFRWKNYWVVKSTPVVLDAKTVQKVALDRCQVDFKTTADGHVEVKLHSINEAKEAKLVKTLQHSHEALKRGEFLIIAGDDKDKWNDAWFVIIRAEP
ncbi:MAG: hypothetical protein ACKPAH_15130 [Verrucomicrobiota bacterium]